jgi:hypothetical protein
MKVNLIGIYGFSLKIVIILCILVIAKIYEF